MSIKCKAMLLFLCMITMMLLCLIFVLIITKTSMINPLFVLKGKNEVNVSIHESYEDVGVIAKHHFKSYENEVKIQSNVDLHKIGTYKIIYEWKNQTIERKVHVIDDIPPKIYLHKGKHIRIFQNSSYQEPGYMIKDNVDQNLTHMKIQGHVDTKKLGTYELTYSIEDKSGNQTKETRKIEVIKDPTDTKLLYHYDQYDNRYEEWWFEKSKDHKQNQAARSQSFLKKYDAFYIGNNEKVIYLTFDEGGNDVTYIKDIVKVLNQHKVPATFFLTRNYLLDETELMIDLVKNGHLIGNHTWHHYDMSILANHERMDDFILELTKFEQSYVEIIGEELKKIFRFPKGGFSERSLKMVHDLGYKTYFWSHAFYDYAHDLSKEEAYQKLVDHYHPGAIYLLHPSNKGNYEAMDDFITLMKSKGYRFGLVDEIK